MTIDDDQMDECTVAIPVPRTIFVSNLAENVDERILRDAFGGFGSIEACTVFYLGTIHSGMAQVKYYQKQHAQTAIKEMAGKLMVGRPMKLVMDPTGQIAQQSLRGASLRPIPPNRVWQFHTIFSNMSATTSQVCASSLASEWSPQSHTQ